jgi:hypothetical protein
VSDKSSQKVQPQLLTRLLTCHTMTQAGSPWNQTQNKSTHKRQMTPQTCQRAKIIVHSAPLGGGMKKRKKILGGMQKKK